MPAQSGTERDVPTVPGDDEREIPVGQPPVPATSGPRPFSHRPLPRRTFTVETWVDGNRVVATQVVHLQTADADVWYGWNAARLVEFIEHGLGVTVHAAGPVPAQPRPPALVVHRFGLLSAAGLATGTDLTVARLRLDPAELDLPDGGGATVRVDLIAQPAGTGRSRTIGSRRIQLAGGQPLDVLLQGSLHGTGAPSRIMATVRVLAPPSGGRAREDLGGATLELVPPRGPDQRRRSDQSWSAPDKATRPVDP